MKIEDVVEFINSHDDPVLTDEMNSLIMATCYQTHRLTMQLNNAYHDPAEIRKEFRFQRHESARRFHSQGTE